jgi:hypothetical protein
VEMDSFRSEIELDLGGLLTVTCRDWSFPSLARLRNRYIQEFHT